MKQTIKMSDIACELGISTVTVSKALSGKEGVGHELREKIKAKAEEMGYQYNDLPKLMREGRTVNIGIIISSKYLDGYSFYWSFYQCLLKQLEKRNYYTLLAIVSADDEAELKRPMMLSNKKIDGFVVLGQLSDKYLTELVKTDIPYVFLDFFSDIGNADCIIANNFYGSYTITKHLIDNGHEKIAFIGSPSATGSILDRYLGYCKALMENGLKTEKAIDDRDKNGEYINFSLDNLDISAYVCNNDEVARRLIKKLNSHNLSVPRDISVVGFDNFDEQITSMEVDIKKMCQNAADILIGKINSPNHYAVGRFLVECRLISKQSVASVRK